MSASTIVINDVEPRRQYTATASQTVFDFPYPFFNDGDLDVYLTPSGQAADDAADLLTISADYTVSGANTQSGGQITLTNPATAGDVITIERVVDLARTSDYQVAGDLLAETLNTEQDTEIMISQQLRKDIDRSVARSATSTSTASLVLPEPVAGKAIGWNGAASALENVEPSQSATADSVFDTKAQLVLQSIDAGLIVETRGYTAAGDNGGAQYLVKTAAQFGGTPDGYGDHSLANGNVAVLQSPRAINIRQYGATGDGSTDDTLAIQAALDKAATFAFGFVPGVYIPEGKYLTTGVVVASYITLFGDGDMSILSLPADVAAGTYSIVSITQDSANSIVMRNFSIWGDNNNQANSPTVYGLRIDTDAPIIYNRFEGLYIKECSTSALFVAAGSGGIDNSFFDRCMFRDSTGSANVYINAADKVDFVQCRIRSGKTGSGHGVLLDNTGVSRVSFKDCRIDDNLGIGIYATNTLGQITVSNCEFIGNTGGGIFLDRSDNSIASNNLMIDNGGAADAHIKTDQSSDSIVSGNVMSGGQGYGIHLDQADNCIVDQNIISGGSGTAAGIYADVSDHSSISNNNVSNRQGHGIFLNVSTYNNVNSNRVYNVGQDSAGLGGIVLDGSSDTNTLQLNNVSSTASQKHSYGIWVASALADANLVTNNSLLDALTANLQDSGTGTVTAAGNRV